MVVNWQRLSDLKDRLHVSEVTVRRWVRRGLPHSKVGGMLLFDPAEVDAWIRAQRPAPQRRKRRRAAKRGRQ